MKAITIFPYCVAFLLSALIDLRADAPSSEGLMLWLDAGKGVTADANGKVSHWADQSSNHNHAAQAILSLQPTLIQSTHTGLPALLLAGGSILDTPSIALGDSFSMFVVVRQNQPGSMQLVVQSPFGKGIYAGEGGFFLSNNTTDGYALGIRTPVQQGFLLYANSWMQTNKTLVGSVIADGPANAATSLYRDGELLATSNYLWNALNPLPLHIGGSSASGTTSSESVASGFYGEISEILIYQDALNPLNRQQVESYLISKYSPIPEPGTVSLIILTCAGAGVYTSSRRRKLRVATGTVD